MQRMLRLSLALICSLLFAAQTPTPFPQTLPANSVVGRLGGGVPGPAEALSFSLLGSQLFAGLTGFSISSVGDLTLGTAGSHTGILNLLGTTSGTLSITAAAAAGTYNFILPATAGTAGQCLVSQAGSAAMTWGACTGSPGGSTTQVQFNSASSFAGSANLTWVSPALTIGVNAATTGQLALATATGGGGSVTLQNPSTTTGWNFNFPTGAGTLGQPLLSGGGGATVQTYGTLGPAGGGTGQTTLTAHGVLVGNGTGNVTQLAASAAGAALMGQGTGADPAFTATPTLGVAGATVGTLAFANASSGSITLSPPAGALGSVTLTLPAATDQIIARATTDTLTNKTYDTAGTGNVLRINGTTVNAVTGTGSVVLATSPTLVTPTLGAASATTINKVTLTQPASGSTLTIADGKVLTASNTLTLNGTDATTFTFPNSTDTVTGIAAAQTLTNKTLTAPTINGGTATALTGLAVRSTGSAFDLTLANTEVLTAGRTLTITLNNAARALNISGDVTTASSFTTAGANPLTLTTTGTTNATLPSGSTTLVATTVTTLSNLASIGTITSGVWNGTAVAVANGGTGQTTAAAARGSSGINIDQLTQSGDTGTVGTPVVIASTTRTMGTTPGVTFSAPRYWQLPAANSLTGGQQLVLADQAGAINGVNVLNVVRAGADTINGATSTSMATQFQQVIFTTDGVSKWSFTSGASGAGSGTVTSVSCGNQTISVSGTCITDDGLGLQNCSLAASVNTSILTVALKDASGNDPTSTSPCTIGFRSNTATTGTVTTRYVTSALSITTNAIGATLGSSNNTAFRFWTVLFDNAGTVVMGLYNASTTTSCVGIDETNVQSSTAMSGSATSAQVYYTPNGTTITSKPVRTAGYVEYNSTGLATAGTYASAPNFIQSFSPGVAKPCTEIGRVTATNSTATTTASTSYVVTNTTVAYTAVSAANLIRGQAAGPLSTTATGVTNPVEARLSFTSNANVFGNEAASVSTGTSSLATASLLGWTKPNSISALTYAVYFKALAGTGSWGTLNMVTGIEIVEIQG